MLYNNIFMMKKKRCWRKRLSNEGDEEGDNVGNDDVDDDNKGDDNVQYVDDKEDEDAGNKEDSNGDEEG